MHTAAGEHVTITAKQLAKRQQYLGASDVARIATGLYGGAAAVQAEKLYGSETKPNFAMRMGDWLEPVAIQYVRDHVGKVRAGGEYRCDGTPLLVHPDGVLEDGRLVEAKTAGLLYATSSGWGEPGTSEVPDYPQWQVQTQMAAKPGCPAVVIVACGPQWEARDGIALYHVEADERRMDQIRKAMPLWWQRHVVDQVPCTFQPEQAPYVIDALKGIPRVGDPVEINPEIVEAWQTMNALRLDLEKGEAAVKALLIQALGNSDTGLLPDGRTFRYAAEKDTRFNLEKFRQDHPDLAREYTETGIRRVLRKPRKG